MFSHNAVRNQGDAYLCEFVVQVTAIRSAAVVSTTAGRLPAAPTVPDLTPCRSRCFTYRQGAGSWFAYYVSSVRAARGA